MSTTDLLDQEFNIASPEALEDETVIENTAMDISQADDIAKAMEFLNKENPYPKLPPKKQVKMEELFPKGKKEIVAYKSPDEMTIPELLEEEHLDEVANEAEEMFQQLSVQALNSSPKCMAELANAAMAFLKMKQDSILAKADNRLKREKLQLEKLKLELKNAKKENGLEPIINQTLPPISLEEVDDDDQEES